MHRLQAGGTGLVLGNVIPLGTAGNAVEAAKVFTVLPSVMTLSGPNSALGHSLAIEDTTAANAIVGCAAL